MSGKRAVRKIRKKSIFDKNTKNRRYETYKYSFSLQKGVKNQKYFLNFEKYNVSAF